MDLQVLHEIDEDLTKSDVAALKFLCKDVLRKKRLEGVKDAKDLFLQLREQNLLENVYFLSELLYTIGRHDLLHLLGTNKAEVSQRLQDQTDSTSTISSYRKMLYKLAEDVTIENLRAIKFLLNQLPKAKLQESATFLDVLTEMEKMQMLAEDNLGELEKVLDKCDKQLASTVQEFRSTQRQRTEVPASLDHPEEEEPMETPNDNLPTQEASTRGESLAAVFTDGHGTRKETDDFYSLKHRPRGYCLIINNYNFEEMHTTRTQDLLRNRRGTERDAEELTRVFKKLHFVPEVRKDLSSSDMLAVIKTFAETDHSEMDAFVCCVLSHGLKGTVFGTDSKEVRILDLTNPFTHCRTLLNKPKLFFFQACQGVLYQKSTLIQADGNEESSDMNLEVDAQSVELMSIPFTADFLIGMATVESYKSFRHIEKGSIYIQELCKQLENGLTSKEDILSILTKVNREVSKKLLNGFKQMPEPRYTLTKKLVFTED